jgi:hypothetical protein
MQRKICIQQTQTEILSILFSHYSLEQKPFFGQGACIKSLQMRLDTLLATAVRFSVGVICPTC